MSICKFCTLEIFWKENNGESIPFEDSHRTAIHKCPKLPQKKYVTTEDHLLLTKTISRMSALERRFAELEKKVM